MKFIVWTMLAGFALAGSFLFGEGLRSLVAAIRQRPHLRRVLGTVMTVEKKRETRSSGDPPRMRTYVKFHPVINFTDEKGKIFSFRSEMGDSYQVVKRWDGTHKEPVSRYSAGQRVEIFHDPEGKLNPCFASWSGLYGPAVILIVSGIVFGGGSALIWFAFGDKLMGR